MFISPCLLFLTLFRMFLQAGEGEASQRGEHGARTLASLPPRVCVSSASSASSWTEKLRPEMERDLPKVTSKCDAEDFQQKELRPSSPLSRTWCLLNKQSSCILED